MRKISFQFVLVCGIGLAAFQALAGAMPVPSPGQKPGGFGAGNGTLVGGKESAFVETFRDAWEDCLGTLEAVGPLNVALCRLAQVEPELAFEMKALMLHVEIEGLELDGESEVETLRLYLVETFERRERSVPAANVACGTPKDCAQDVLNRLFKPQR